MSKTLFIVNPVAGNGSGIEASEKINKILVAESLEAEIYLTQGQNDATNYVSGLNVADYHKVVAVGGDGTVNEVANGVMLNSGDISFTAVPVGSGNDFVRMLDMPRGFEDNILSIVKNNQYKRYDIAKVIYKLSDDKENVRYFINSLGLGFDAQIAYIKSISPGMTGIKAYILALIKALGTYKPVQGNLVMDEDAKIEFNSLLMTLGNGITSGGGFFLNPRAVIDDGILDLTIIQFVSRLKIMYKLPLALLNKLEKVPEADFYNFKQIDISLKKPYYVHVDGEVLSTSVKNLKVEVLKSAIKIG